MTAVIVLAAVAGAHFAADRAFCLWARHGTPDRPDRATEWKKRMGSWPEGGSTNLSRLLAERHVHRRGRYCNRTWPT